MWALARCGLPPFPLCLFQLIWFTNLYSKVIINISLLNTSYLLALHQTLLHCFKLNQAKLHYPLFITLLKVIVQFSFLHDFRSKYLYNSQNGWDIEIAIFLSISNFSKIERAFEKTKQKNIFCLYFANYIFTLIFLNFLLKLKINISYLKYLKLYNWKYQWMLKKW